MDGVTCDRLTSKACRAVAASKRQTGGFPWLPKSRWMWHVSKVSMNLDPDAALQNIKKGL